MFVYFNVCSFRYFFFYYIAILCKFIFTLCWFYSCSWCLYVRVNFIVWDISIGFVCSRFMVNMISSYLHLSICDIICLNMISSYLPLSICDLMCLNTMSSYLCLNMTSRTYLSLYVIFLKMGHLRPIFLYFCLFNTQLKVNKYSCACSQIWAKVRNFQISATCTTHLSKTTSRCRTVNLPAFTPLSFSPTMTSPSP